MGNRFDGNMEISIEAMRDNDWDAVRRIYVEGLATGNASFETEAPSWDTWNSKFYRHSRWSLVRSCRVVAWVALAPISSRACYAGVAEVSLYVTDDCRGRGVGKKLLEAVIASSEENGIWTLQGGTFPENVASLQLQDSCGFRVVGRRERIGKHNGVWRDTVMTERRSSLVGTE